MIGPWHLPIFDAAIDRRHRSRRRRPPVFSPTRQVQTWHSRTMTGPHVIWPPVHRDDQAEYARRAVAAKAAGGALVTVLHRKGATAVVVIDVFGDPLLEFERRQIRRVLDGLRPRSFFRIKPWVAVEVNQYGAFTTNAVDVDDLWVDRLGEALGRLELILAGDPANGRSAA